MSRHHIASVSWGKDSLAMLHMLIDDAYPLDEVVFFDTSMEFPAVYAERDRMLSTLWDLGIKYIELRPKDPMWWSMFCRPVKSRTTGEVHKHGYGWCGGPCRWGTTAKQRALDRVSCWCCRNKNQRELRAIHDHLPAYWERLLAMEDVLGQMKGKPLRQIAGEADA